MATSQFLKLQSTRDDFSFQVSAANDQRFWFRLEREPSRDVITDYFIGSVPESRAGRALIDCYQHLGLMPKSVLVFRDILPSSEAEDDPEMYASALNEAQHLFAECGKAVLEYFGASTTQDRLERRRGKYDLVVQADDE